MKPRKGRAGSRVADVDYPLIQQEIADLALRGIKAGQLDAETCASFAELYRIGPMTARDHVIAETWDALAEMLRAEAQERRD